MFGGVRVLCTPAALQDSEIRLFPASKNRSKRIRKKLIQRFGGEFKQVPAIYQAGDTFYAHPALYHMIKQHIVAAKVPRPLVGMETLLS